VMCMWLINQAAGLADLISPLNDHASLEREIAKIRSRPSFAVPVSSPRRSVPLQGIATLSNHADTAAGLAALLSKADSK
jgi:hypothetical protein